MLGGVDLHAQADPKPLLHQIQYLFNQLKCTYSTVKCKQFESFIKYILQTVVVLVQHPNRPTETTCEYNYCNLP